MSGPPSYQTIPPYQGEQTGQTVPVVVTQPVVVSNQFRDYPVIIVDSKGQQVETVLEYRNGLLTWIAVFFTCMATLGLGLCFLGLIPLCVKGLKDVYHISPTDGKVVGVYKRL